MLEQHWSGHGQAAVLGHAGPGGGRSRVHGVEDLGGVVQDEQEEGDQVQAEDG